MRVKKRAAKVLVVDIGGSHVKVLATGHRHPRKFDSGPDLIPETFVATVQTLVRDWKYDVVAVGYPGPVGRAGVCGPAGNLGPGWEGFDFEKAFERPTRVENDAAMQALGTYRGGRMLFLGLGTGLGSALVAEQVLIPLELGSLSFQSTELFKRLGKQGLARLGKRKWQRAVREAADVLHRAFAADYIVLGGGNAALVKPLPPHCRRGGNHDAFTGGFRLWEERIEPHDEPRARVWRVVR